MQFNIPTSTRRLPKTTNSGRYSTARLRALSATISLSLPPSIRGAVQDNPRIPERGTAFLQAMFVGAGDVACWPSRVRDAAGRSRGRARCRDVARASTPFCVRISDSSSRMPGTWHFRGRDENRARFRVRPRNVHRSLPDSRRWLSSPGLDCVVIVQINQFRLRT